MNLTHIQLDSVISTNDEAINLIKKKNFLKPTILSANNQKKGRGTHGRKWVSKKGNIFISIVFNLDNKKLKFYQISILNPIIIKNIFKKYLKNKISIKPPNDLLVKKKKICGILQEVITFKEKKYLIIGIGINSKISPKSKKFKHGFLEKYSNITINNKKIISDIKKSYEKFISDISKHKFVEIKKKLEI